jgi:hypothetical protein
LWDDILAYSANHPGMTVEVSWRAVPTDDDIGAADEEAQH